MNQRNAHILVKFIEIAKYYNLEILSYKYSVLCEMLFC